LRHQYSGQFVAEKLPPPSFQAARFIGAGVACIVGTGIVLWRSGPYSLSEVFGFAFYLALCLALALLVIGVRRFFRPPEDLRSTVAEVDRNGLWRETARSRTLMFGRAELRSISVYKSSLNDIYRVVLHGPARTLRVEGLENMYAFVQDLRSMFPAVEVVELKHQDGLGSSSASAL
jgi:hypothetical protein